MVSTLAGRYSQVIHPLHAVLLAGSATLFMGAAVSDVAYARSYQVQWTNFASWFIVGGLLFAGLALLFLLADLVRARQRAPGIGRYALVLLAAWVIGFFNALIHAKDVWAAMPAGLVLSVVVAVLAVLATWLGFAARHTGATR